MKHVPLHLDVMEVEITTNSLVGLPDDFPGVIQEPSIMCRKDSLILQTNLSRAIVFTASTECFIKNLWEDFTDECVGRPNVQENTALPWKGEAK